MKREFEITPTVAEIAEAFSLLGAHDQGRFFCLVAEHFESWGAFQRDTQILSIADILTNVPMAESGLNWVRSLGESTSLLPCEEVKP